MGKMKILYYDCFSGISGDMNLAAMIDLGLNKNFLLSELKKLKLSGYTIRFSKEQRSGITGTRVDVITDPSENQIRRNLSDIEKIIDTSDLNKQVKSLSKRIFVELGKAEAKTIDSLIWEVVAEGGIGLRADADANESGERTISTAGSTNTTTRICWAAASAMSGLASGDTGIVVFLSGKNYGQVRQFTCDATNPTYETTVTALDHACESGDLIRLVTTMGLTTADVVTCETIRKAVALLESNGSAVFDDGYYHAVYSPLTKYDFMRDTEWINMKHFAAPKDLYRNLDGEIYNVRFHKDNNPYRHTAGTIGTWVAGGAVYVISIFGKNSFGNVRVSGIDNKWYACPPVADPSNPLSMFGTMGYYALCCPVVLNGCNIVNIFNVPTSF